MKMILKKGNWLRLEQVLLMNGYHLQRLAVDEFEITDHKEPPKSCEICGKSNAAFTISGSFYCAEHANNILERIRKNGL